MGIVGRNPYADIIETIISSFPTWESAAVEEMENIPPCIRQLEIAEDIEEGSLGYLWARCSMSCPENSENIFVVYFPEYWKENGEHRMVARMLLICDQIRRCLYRYCGAKSAGILLSIQYTILLQI